MPNLILQADKIKNQNEKKKINKKKQTTVLTLNKDKSIEHISRTKMSRSLKPKIVQCPQTQVRFILDSKIQILVVFILKYASIYLESGPFGRIYFSLVDTVGPLYVQLTGQGKSKLNNEKIFNKNILQILLFTCPIIFSSPLSIQTFTFFPLLLFVLQC